MSCCQCQGIEDLFNDQLVGDELTRYRKNGADPTTRVLVDEIIKMGVRGGTLLDVGGGVGAIQHALLAAGAQSAVDVDASQAYIAAARSEAVRRGLADRIQFIHGNFINLAEQVPPVDIVTLDRVLCCYPDVENMVRLSVAHARRLYGLVYPQDTWWARIGITIMNLYFRLRKSSYRSFIHSTTRVESIIEQAGFTRKVYRRTFVWQVAVYSRP